MDSNTFDLAAALSGQTYPEEEVIVPLDRKTAKEINDKREEHRRRKNIRGVKQEELDELTQDIKDLEEQAKGNSLIITVRSLPKHALKNLVISQAEAQEMERKDDETRGQFQVRKNERIQFLSWMAYIAEIKASTGETVPVTEESVTMLVDQLADPVDAQIQEAISGLDNEARAGFESIVTNEDF